MCLSVRTLELKSSILQSSEKRGHDEWALTVSSRVQSCNDLVAEEAIYHKSCHETHDRFHLRKPMTGDSDNPPLEAAHRPLDMTKQASFLTLCEWLETQTDRYLYSVTELRDQLLKFGYSEDAVYLVKYLKTLLHFGALCGSCSLCRRRGAIRYCLFATHGLVCFMKMLWEKVHQRWMRTMLSALITVSWTMI